MPKYRGVLAPISVTPHYKDFGLLEHFGSISDDGTIDMSEARFICESTRQWATHIQEVRDWVAG